eukprot:CAMPEP_0185705928 /NCGR_PEP_ID=MMETSP1164-20130828/20886_1 /TAXON_ID=1104430 /ORGANISM="Chrysoreinhardia sp, Strain CCMP2950" /LENGTH=919 /DNA_ID=CAMNT_0028373321 /DNA_START=71 /DNA_END=2830 /DNA_ORIENTATION=+
MGNAVHAPGSRVVLTRDEKRVVKKFESKFTEAEMSQLARIFRQLAIRSPNATVDPEHFEEYVCFPGLHGEQVFRAFDSKKTGNLDFEEFVSGLARSARGTKAEKVKFLFEIYDLKGDGYVWKAELQKMVNQMPRETFKHVEADHTRGSRDHRFVAPNNSTGGTTASTAEADDDDDATVVVETDDRSLVEAKRDPHPVGVAAHRFLQRPTPSKPKPRFEHRASDSRLLETAHHHKEQQQQRRQTVASSLRSAHRWEACTNDDVADRAFETSDWNRDGRLSFEQFEHWIDTVPEVLQYVDATFEHAMATADRSAHGPPAPPHLDGRLRSEIVLPPLPTGTKDSAAPPVAVRPGRAVSTDAALSGALDASQYSATSSSGSSGAAAASKSSSSKIARGVSSAPSSALKLKSSKSSGDHEADDMDADAASRTSSDVRFEGQLSKVGALTHHLTSRYFVLVGNCLYYYLKKGDAKPKGLVFLGGCQVEPIKNSHIFPPYKHGFRVVHLDAERLGQRQHTLYAASADERDAWVRALVRAISSPRWSRKNGAFDVTEYYDLGEELGAGRFAVARRAVDRASGRKVAVKSIEKRASLYGADHHQPTPLGAAAAAPAAPPGEETKEGGGAAGQQNGGDDDEAGGQNAPPPPEPYDESRARDEREMFRREIAVMRLARHDSVLPLLAVFEDRTHVHLVTPLMDCDLASYLRKRQELGAPTDEKDARICLPVVLEAVAYLHHLGVAHRDLKPDNILMDDADDLSRLRLADFSISQILKPDETSSKVAGSVEYMAPEIFLKKGAGFPADVWAVGVIAILVLFYRQPFGWGDSKAETIGAILDNEIDPDLDWASCSPEAKDLFVNQMLVTDPKKRITAHDALESHAWSLRAQRGAPKRTAFERSNSEPTWLKAQLSTDASDPDHEPSEESSAA